MPEYRAGDAASPGQTDDLGQRPSLVGHAGAGAVEIHHVDPADAPGDVAGGQGGRVPVALLPVEVSLGETHRRTAAPSSGLR